MGRFARDRLVDHHARAHPPTKARNVAAPARIVMSGSADPLGGAGVRL
jgi:hypothetical protein